MASTTFRSDKKASHSTLVFSPLKTSLKQNLHVRKIFRLQQVRSLSDDTYVLRLDRNDMSFRAGQHITLGIPGNNQVREYSIYSVEQDPSLEVLIKEVDAGLVSKQLRKMLPGEILDVDGPFGYFYIDEKNIDRRFLFIGTGTGISPFHSIIGSYPDLDYTLLHGVRYGRDSFEKHWYAKGRHILCTSRDDGGHFQGRVTDYLKQMSLHSDTLIYLCGNCDMIYDVYDYLTSKGFPSGSIKTEVYF